MLPSPIDTTYKLPSGPTSMSVMPPKPSPNTMLLNPGEDGFSMTLDARAGGRTISFVLKLSIIT